MTSERKMSKDGTKSQFLAQTYKKAFANSTYRFWLILLGLPIHLLVYFIYLFKRKEDSTRILKEKIEKELVELNSKELLLEESREEYKRKQIFFQQKIVKADMEKYANEQANDKYNQLVQDKLAAVTMEKGTKEITFLQTFEQLLANHLFVILTLIPGLLMYVLLVIFSQSYVKYIFERVIMSLFVIIGVSVFVFTILYLSPMNPAANILGETATKEQIANFNRIYGLDQSYLVQLWNAVKGILTFDLGNSYTGNEDVVKSIMNKFPITFTITIISLIMAIIIAIPIGIISATRPNSFFDYTCMFIALLGLSIPNFWQGLIFILYFSIKGHWLPATYTPGNILSMIMPIIVLGTALTASVARMTRSSMLEVINEDYIITARAKGLNNRQVLWGHAVKNAMIPVITVIGLLFGGMLGGAAVTEKVFNISGIGSYIVDKQFIPDIPSVMGGVVYVAITISLVNLLIDVSYAFFDPRIRSKMKQY